MSDEIRKPIPGYEGIYEVSNKGNVYSLPRIDNNNVKRGGHKLKPIIDKYGYCYVFLYKDGIRHREKIHRIVGKVFCGGYSKDKQINHKDENKANNEASNLEWVSNKENVNYGCRNDVVSKKLSSRERRTIQQIDCNGLLLKEFPNAAEAARNTGIANTHIIACCKGRAKTAGGFFWQYKI